MHELAIYSHTTFKAHLLGLVGQHIWRRTARALECWWRERTKKLRATAKEPQHPADGQDHAVAGEVDTIAERQPATHGNPSCLSVAPLGSRAQQGSAKTIAKRRKKPK